MIKKVGLILFLLLLLPVLSWGLDLSNCEPCMETENKVYCLDFRESKVVSGPGETGKLYYTVQKKAGAFGYPLKGPYYLCDYCKPDNSDIIRMPRTGFEMAIKSDRILVREIPENILTFKFKE